MIRALTLHVLILTNTELLFVSTKRDHRRELRIFIRVYRDNKKTEVVYNLDHVSQIEVKYGILDSGSGIISRIHPIDAANCDDAIRSYKLYIAGDEILLAANPDCPVMKAIENIYINSLKGD